MKNWLFILFLFPLTMLSQGDFESRYFTITSESLPTVDAISDFKFDQTPFIRRSLDEFQMNSDNYRSAVNMVAAIKSEESLLERNVDLSRLNAKFGSLGDQSLYPSDGKTTVKNSVYKEMRGLQFLDACPPFGICARCAPYRVGRGF